MQFERLSLQHGQQLLEFEQRNRQFFESLVAPRATDFYSRDGIVKYITALLDEQAQGTLSPWVVIDNGDIIARANLHNILPRLSSAYVGYRVDQRMTGRGVATLCLQHLLTVAKEKLNLTTLYGRVLDNNPASAHILIKQGFKAEKALASPVTIQGTEWNGQQYSFLLTESQCQ